MRDEIAGNVARLHEAWDKWDQTKGADTSMWEDYMTDDIRLFSLAEGSGPLDFTAERSGIEEVRRYLDGLTSVFAMDFWRIDETVAQGDTVVGLGVTGWTGRDSGKTFVTPVVIVTRWRDGRIYEYREYYDTAKVAATAA
ncbi:MAG: nuclear transport factor 2 family protein [Marinibacterium sp.]